MGIRNGFWVTDFNPFFLSLCSDIGKRVRWAHSPRHGECVDSWICYECISHSEKVWQFLLAQSLAMRKHEPNKWMTITGYNVVWQSTPAHTNTGHKPLSMLCITIEILYTVCVCAFFPLVISSDRQKAFGFAHWLNLLSPVFASHFICQWVPWFGFFLFFRSVSLAEQWLISNLR